jgi:hypothetical protein
MRRVERSVINERLTPILMKKIILPAFIVLLCLTNCMAQINYTANDPGSIPSYNNHFLFGTNMGYYGPTWDDMSVADIAAGNPAKNVKGAGAKTLRPSLYEGFLETWGYDVRLIQFAHYASLGVQDNTVFLGLPASDAHRDPNNYGGCADQSNLFKNMYEPIWDGGLNGTPVNENNYYALYVYKTVTRYKQWTKFWEIVNEPDQDGGTSGWKGPGVAGNWWENNPTPCELLNTKAPIYHYIRLLRISYEVIKTIDPNAYVAPGGVGYASYLDALLRNTDNPVDGSVTAQYPNKGGAYFDCMSFHSYPIYSLQYWDPGAGQMAYRRHSDAATEDYIGVKNEMELTLANRGYNGTTYPKKIVICTESNIPRKAIGNFIGSDAAQRNYYLKSIVESQKNDIRQLYLYGISEAKDFPVASDPFHTMGMYNHIEGLGPLGNGGQYLQQYTEQGIGSKTASDILLGYKYDAVKTATLALPANIKGAAFKNTIGDFIFVLWAKTTTDNSEAASAIYSFPPATNVSGQLYKKEWNFSQTNSATLISPQNIALTGAPIFLSEQLVITDLRRDSIIRNNQLYNFNLLMYPNPLKDKLLIKLTLKKKLPVAINIFNSNGQLVSRNAGKTYDVGDAIIGVPLPTQMAAGLYYCSMEIGNWKETRKFVVAK